MRSGATPDCPNKAMISAARCVLRTRVRRRREVGNLTRICTQQRQQGIAGLGQVVETAERDKTGLACGQRNRHRRCSERPKAPLRIRHAQQALAMPLISGYRRIGNGIGDPIVHRRETGRGRIPQIADLHGRGAARENRQPVGCRVSREIDEDINPIGADQLDQCIVSRAARPRASHPRMRAGAR